MSISPALLIRKSILGMEKNSERSDGLQTEDLIQAFKSLIKNYLFKQNVTIFRQKVKLM